MPELHTCISLRRGEEHEGAMRAAAMPRRLCRHDNFHVRQRQLRVASAAAELAAHVSDPSAAAIGPDDAADASDAKADADHLPAGQNG